MTARSLPGRSVEDAQAALLAACVAEGIQTATQLQLACADARQAREARQLLTVQLALDYTRLYGTLEGHKQFCYVMSAGNTLPNLLGNRALMELREHAAAVQIEVDREVKVGDDARVAGRAYAEGMLISEKSGII